MTGVLLLDVAGLSAGYGDFQALFDVDLRVAEGETVAVIGANGAGKSTLLRTVAGLVTATGGAVRFAGEDLLAVPAHRRVIEGIALVPEGRRLFPSMTVAENLLVGAHARRPGPWTVARVLDVLPLIEPLMGRSADVLSGGERQAVAIGRALMSNPRLMLWDEASLGLAPVIVDRIYEVVRELNAQGVTILLVEQNANYALDVSARGYVLETGKVALTDTSENLRNDERVQAAYLGA